MNKKIIILIGTFTVATIISAGFFSGSLGEKKEKENLSTNPIVYNASTTVIAVGGNDSVVKEFYMKSFTEVIGGKYHPQFSLKNITVNKGDLVRIKITDTGGVHDFKIDEFNVFAETPIDKEVMVEFTANKTGTFIYYCSKQGHRSLGHWGTLVVKEK